MLTEPTSKIESAAVEEETDMVVCIGAELIRLSDLVRVDRSAKNSKRLQTLADQLTKITTVEQANDVLDASHHNADRPQSAERPCCGQRDAHGRFTHEQRHLVAYG